MFLKNHFQLGYVTHDLDAAMSLFAKRFGQTAWQLLEAPDMAFQTPTGVHPGGVKGAVAWNGPVQIELIQPISGYMDHYRSAMLADETDPTPQFHHVGVRRDDEAAMRGEIAQLGLPLLVEGSRFGLIFVYLDARAVLGHIFEYVCAPQSIWDQLGWPADKPVTY